MYPDVSPGSRTRSDGQPGVSSTLSNEGPKAGRPRSGEDHTKNAIIHDTQPRRSVCYRMRDRLKSHSVVTFRHYSIILPHKKLVANVGGTAHDWEIIGQVLSGTDNVEMPQTSDVVQRVRLHINLRSHQPIMLNIAGIRDWIAATAAMLLKRHVETDRFPRVQLHDLHWAAP